MSEMRCLNRAVEWTRKDKIKDEVIRDKVNATSFSPTYQGAADRVVQTPDTDGSKPTSPSGLQLPASRGESQKSA
ncbi:hypothetical protein PoB_004727200 [Plakobranchus ocellatus]|uniref:Uncharacterized protein n=1 Tax=Plakobranchus ocellatus TaxID=259542 RepID=A0AAV4BN35_9GAST|nr:hypothetical protein PoB_004727200 [Plakobranchus ocellatus]